MKTEPHSKRRSPIDTRPRCSTGDARRITRELYGYRASVRALRGERDRNFLVTLDSGERRILKVSNSADDEGTLEFQTRAMAHLAENTSVAVPRLFSTLSGESMPAVELSGGQRHRVRLLSYLPGRFVTDCRPLAQPLLLDIGRTMAMVDRGLLGFTHPAMHREFQWNMRNVLHTVGRCRGAIIDPRRTALADYFTRRYRQRVVPRLRALRASVIHNDANDHNVLVDASDPVNPKVAGIIDFGDMVHGWIVVEPAIAAAYAALDEPDDPMVTAQQVVSGYHDVNPLTDMEISVLIDFLCMRLVLSVTLSAYQQQSAPDDPYLAISEQPAWVVLAKLREICPEDAGRAFRSACAPQ